MAEVDKQTESLCKSAPGFSVLFIRALVESCVWKSFVSELPPAQWLPSMLGTEIMEMQFLRNEAGGKVANSFRSKTAALRAEWAHLLNQVGKNGFSEKGNWGYKSYVARKMVNDIPMSIGVYQGVLPIFVDSGPVMDIEAVKPQAAAVPSVTTEVPAAPVVSEEARAEAKASAVQNALAFMARRRNRKAAPVATEEASQAPESPVEAPESPVEAPDGPTEAEAAE